MLDAHTLLLVAALAAPPDSAARAASASDSALASVVAPLVQPGARMRVHTGFGVTEGYAGSVDPLGLHLRHESADVWSKTRVEALTWSQIERIDLRTHQPATGAKAGAVVGCLVGVATVMSIASYASAYGDGGYGGATILFGGLVGGIAGACMGGLVGGLVDSTVPAWETIYERR